MTSSLLYARSNNIVQKRKDLREENSTAVKKIRAVTE
jgi:hypothetical protein